MTPEQRRVWDYWVHQWTVGDWREVGEPEWRAVVVAADRILQAARRYRETCRGYDSDNDEMTAVIAAERALFEALGVQDDA